MAEGRQTTIRRMDADDPALIHLVAEQDGAEIGFVYGYVLQRPYGKGPELFVYELSVDEPYRRQGIATLLMRALLAEEAEAFVLTEPENDAANAVYRALGGKRSEVVMWEW